mmetsp:Transcript_74251/g.150800  ORF Transcript_74251/g.150800 Transcript_74251/m.150800 type:complete len:351 (+) Transcript_74251:82-1134(+)
MADDAPVQPKPDQYGDLFLDFGFLQKAEDCKASGNAAFKKDQFDEALLEYDAALALLKTLAEDPSIKLGKRKWDDIVILRSTIHLNKSACHYKAKSFGPAIEEASACLVGNVREDVKNAALHVQRRWEELSEKKAWLSVPEVDRRLPKSMCAKAWFRLTKCHARLGYPDRAKYVAAQALKCCDSKDLRTEILQFSKPFDSMVARQKAMQKKKYNVLWKKLDMEGGYMPKKFDRKSRAQDQFSSLKAVDKVRHLEELDGSDGDSDDDFDLAADSGAALEGKTGLLALGGAGEAAQRPQEAPVQSQVGYNFGQVMSARKREEQLRMAAWKQRHAQALGEDSAGEGEDLDDEE